MATSTNCQSDEDLHTRREIRIVMIGFRDAGKRSAGNTIMQGDMFDKRKTVQCVKKVGEVAGKRVTVINTPGMGREQLLKDSPELTKAHIILSMSLCPPGPHAVLLVIRVDVKLTETNRRVMQEHLELLGERVWSHTILLFTCGDWLGDTSIEEYIESEGKIMEWLVEQCGNRYHVLNNVIKDDKFQVLELLQKVEEMVRKNNGWHYEIDRQRLHEIEEKKKYYEEKAKKRIKEVYQLWSQMKCRKDAEGTDKTKDGAVTDVTKDPNIEHAETVVLVPPQLEEDNEVSSLAVTGGPTARTSTAIEVTELNKTSELVSANKDGEPRPAPTSKTVTAVLRPSVASDDHRKDARPLEAPSILTVPVRPFRNRRPPDRYKDYHMS